jgi:YggT family protein
MLALAAGGHYICGDCRQGACIGIGKGLGLLMCSVIELVSSVVMLYFWMIMIQVVMSWLVVFNVINTQNRFVFMVGDFLHKITEPALGPIRRLMPNLGGIDLSPVVLILLLIFLQNLLREVSGCGHGF